MAISADAWREAEKAAEEVLHCIRPTALSGEGRRAVVEYLNRRIKAALGGEVFLVGSVPLETYLPDGDIDLTVLVTPSSEAHVAIRLWIALGVQEQKEPAKFEVTDLQCIAAEVQLVRCRVENIQVDITFNQIGGLTKLCFLEKADRLIGNDHLLKRSIILIKAWCHYESQILDSRNYLLGTYALETMVLYIINRFHSSLDAPLAVLYRFLDYYSKFDWKNYCISLDGPIAESSRLNLLADAPERGDLLFSSEFLKSCREIFSVPPREKFREFELNIIDPLRENNNIGRTVSKASFAKILCALDHGSRHLSQILLSPKERVAEGITAFFRTTLETSRNQARPDVQVALK